jgi:hypothetical protein
MDEMFLLYYHVVLIKQVHDVFAHFLASLGIRDMQFE